ncbi:YycH family regulatory protein [Periweissella cryptocerci]|nr:two-component system activity regulator YycH [Periweissella cryptocerci]
MRNKRQSLSANFGVLQRYLLPIATTVVIIVSLIFTWLIWTNPAHFNRKNTTSSAPNTEMTARSLTDIYAPTQVIYSDDMQNQELLYDPKVNMVNELEKTVRQWRLVDLKPLAGVTAKSYAKLLGQKNAIILNFPDSVSGQVFNETFYQNLKMKQDVEFNRVLIPLKNPKQMYLMNDNDFSIFKTSVVDANIKNVMKTVNTAAVRIPVAERLYKDRTLLTYPEGVTLDQYSYLLNKQDQSFFVTSLLNNGGVSSVKTKRTEKQTVYEDGNFRRMTVDNKNGAVLYQNFVGRRETHSFDKRLRQGFDDLVTIGVPLDNIRYFESNEDGVNLTYRTYVEGFPIFNQTRYGTVQLDRDIQGNEQTAFSLYSLQVPLPNNKKPIRLISSDEVFQQLKSTGIKPSDIEDMQVGYEWVANPNSDMVIDLKPVWYVEMNGKWKLLSEIAKNN